MPSTHTHKQVATRPCPVCGSSFAATAPTEYSAARLVVCRQCTARFSGDRPTEEELRSHYDLYDRDQVVSELTLARYDALLETFASHCRTGSLLDFGCGSGDFLLRARRLGWHPLGAEFDQSAIETCVRRGVEVVGVDALESAIAPGSLDAVTMFEVIEHLPEPREHLALLKSLLRPGGLLYVTTPNFDSATRRLIGARWRVIEYPEHLTYFTATTLQRLCVDVGFESTSVATYNLSPGAVIGALRNRHASPSASAEVPTRSMMSRSTLVRTSISGVNKLVALSGLGDTIKGTFATE